MNSTVIASGNQWAKDRIDSCWSPAFWGDVTPDQAQQFGDEVLLRFEQLAKEAGGQVGWFPQQSEVVGPAICPLKEAHLVELRNRAAAWVRAQHVHGWPATGGRGSSGIGPSAHQRR